MARLTKSDDSGNWSLKGVPWDSLRPGAVITEDTYEHLYGALEKLRDYEDSGFTPRELEIVDENIDDIAYLRDMRRDRLKGEA